MEELNFGNMSSKNQNQATQKAIDKALSAKCKRHPSRNADCLHLLPSVQTAKICLNCIQQDKIPTENYLQIREVLSASSESDLFTYPILSDPLLRDAVKQNGQDLDSVQQAIDTYFLDILKLIQVNIENNKKTQKQKVIELGSIFQRSMVCWGEIMNLKTLQDLLLEDGNDEKLSQFIRNHFSRSENNTQRLREVCNQFKAIKDQFSLRQPEKIRNLISGLLQEMNFFQGVNPSPLRAIEQSNDTNALQRKQQELEVCQNQNREAQQKILEYQQIIRELRGEKDIQSNEIANLKQENILLKQQIDIKDLLASTQLTLSKIQDSKYLSVQKNQQNQIEFSNNTNNFQYGQAYLDFILDPAANYILQIKLEQQKGQDKWFFFGLMRDSKKDTTDAYNENLCYSEYDGENGINTLVKGKSILTDNHSLVSRSLEMRINIQRRIIRVGSLPDYESVVQVDEPERIDPAIPYRFLLKGLNSNTKMTIMKLETVSSFDNSM